MPREIFGALSHTVDHLLKTRLSTMSQLSSAYIGTLFGHFRKVIEKDLEININHLTQANIELKQILTILEAHRGETEKLTPIYVLLIVVIAILAIMPSISYCLYV